jgi:hypothetical protein
MSGLEAPRTTRRSAERRWPWRRADREEGSSKETRASNRRMGTGLRQVRNAFQEGPSWRSRPPKDVVRNFAGRNLAVTAQGDEARGDRPDVQVVDVANALEREEVVAERVGIEMPW